MLFRARRLPLTVAVLAVALPLLMVQASKKKQPACVRGLTASFIHAAETSPAARCFAAYALWDGYGGDLFETLEGCANSVQLSWPRDFFSRNDFSSQPNLDMLGLTAAEWQGLLQSRNDIEAFWQHYGKPTAVFPPWYTVRNHTRYNASLAILSTRSGTTKAAAGYFETLQDLKQSCGAPNGIVVLADLVMFAYLYFYLKEASTDTLSSSLRHVAPALLREDELDASLFSSLWFCAHNKNFSGAWGVRYSVPYLHLHATNQLHYGDFMPEQDRLRGVISLADYTTPSAWGEHGGVCARGADAVGEGGRGGVGVVGEGGSLTVRVWAERVAAALWKLLPDGPDPEQAI